MHRNTSAVFRIVSRARQGCSAAAARRFSSQAPNAVQPSRAGVAAAAAAAVAAAAAGTVVLGATAEEGDTKSYPVDTIVESPTGLMYLDTVRGAGELAKAGDSVLVHYEGKTNGFGPEDPVFDSSYVHFL